MTGYTHRMPGIYAASGAAGTTEAADAWHAARTARERADRLERYIEAIKWRLGGGMVMNKTRERRMLRLLSRYQDEYQQADAVAKAGGE